MKQLADNIVYLIDVLAGKGKPEDLPWQTWMQIAYVCGRMQRIARKYADELRGVQK